MNEGRGHPPSADPALNDARAFLEAMAKSKIDELLVSTANFSLHISRSADGSLGRMAARRTPEAAHRNDVGGITRIEVRAPHICTLTWIAATGENLASGAILARIAVLDADIAVLTPTDGLVAELHAAPGELLEHDCLIATIAAPANGPGR